MDNNDRLLAQTDEPPFLPTSQWIPDTQYAQQLALAVPAAAKPGSYSLELVVYGQADGKPLPLPAHERSIHGQRWRLGMIQLQSPQVMPKIGNLAS